MVIVDQLGYLWVLFSCALIHVCSYGHLNVAHI